MKEASTKEVTEVEEQSAYLPINWRDRIPQNEIVLNRDLFKKKGIDVDQLPEEDLSSLKETAAPHELLIKLNGFKEVARMRGLVRSLCDVIESSADRVVVKQTLEFQSNRDNPNGLIVECVANATTRNVRGDTFQSFLEPIAQNRAFVRAVKDALGINILGQDELLLEQNPIIIENESGPSVHSALEQLMKNKGVEWDSLKKTLVLKKHEYIGCEEWGSIKDIPQSVVLVIMKELKNINKN